MLAAVYRRFGGPEVVSVEEVPTPVAGPREVLIRVRAASVSMGDYRVRSRDLPEGLGFLGPLALGIFGPRKPILGMDLAGTIEAVGSEVTRWKVGDDVIAMPQAGFGGHAQYRAMPEDGPMALKPKNLGFDDAVSLVFGGSTLIAFFEQAPVRPGQAVLVNGGSSATGVAAIQLAHHAGGQVTAVCSSRNEALVRDLGASKVIDYTKHDFATLGDTYDMVIDCIGNGNLDRIGPILRQGGTYVPVVASLGTMLTAGGKAKRQGKRALASNITPTAAHMRLITDLAESGALRPVVDRTYPLADIVEAHRYLDTFRKRGAIVLQMP